MLHNLEKVKALALFLLPLLAILAWRMPWRDWTWWKRPGTWLLLVLAGLSVFHYVRWEKRSFPHWVEGYDVYHYYMGGKYRKEVGTDLIYACSLVGDKQRNRPRFDHIKAVRDLRDYKMKSAKKMRREASLCPRIFTKARWKEFKRDLWYFKRINAKHTWRRVFIDRGTNASPGWHLLGGLVARLTPANWLVWTTKLDVLLVAVALGFVVWAFGLDVALVTLVFLLNSFSARWPGIGAGFFRYDWLAAAIVSVCLLRKGRPLWAGASMAAATAIRLFPVVVLAGMAMKGLRELLGKRRFERTEKRLLVGFVGAGVLLGGLALADGGPASIAEFARKISMHAASENISIMRVGLPVASAWRGELTRKDLGSHLSHTRSTAQKQSLYLKIVVVLFMGLLFWWAPRLSDSLLLLLGFAMFPLALQASYYYYVLLAVPVVLHAEGLARWSHALCLLFLCWCNAAALWANATGVHRYLILGPGSVLMVLYAVALFVGAGVIWFRARPRTRRVEGLETMLESVQESEAATGGWNGPESTRWDGRNDDQRPREVNATTRSRALSDTTGRGTNGTAQGV